MTSRTLDSIREAREQAQAYAWTIKNTTIPDFVRCRECVRRDGRAAVCTLTYLSVGPNDYCSKGERATDGDESR